MRCWRPVWAMAAACCWLYSGIAVAGAIESSYRTARKVIEGSIAYMQADHWLRDPVPLMIEASGTYFQGAEHQGYAPDDPTPAEFHETWAFDPATGRVGREYRQHRPDGTTEWIREVFLEDDEQLLIDLAGRRAVHLRSGRLAATRDRNLRRFPPLLLQESLQRPESLRFIGRYGPFNSVQVQTRTGESLSLFFGRESHALGWVEYLADLPTFADSTVAWKFSDYRQVDGAGRLPHKYGIHVNEAPLTDMTVRRVVSDAEVVEAFLALPKGIPSPAIREVPPDWSPLSRARVERVGDGVYRLENLRAGFHTVFVEFDSFVLVVDAPAGYPLLNELPAGDVAPGLSESAISANAIDLIRETVGQKPVEYLVLTHFHNDHAGGLLAYAGLPITVLTEDSEVGSLRAFLGSNHTLCTARRGISRPPDHRFTIQAVTERHVMSEGGQRVEILDVGANPHTAHMLVVWLPRQKILYASDLLTGVAGKPDPSHGLMNEAFLAWTDAQGLDPKLILTAHGDGLVYPAPRSRVASQQTLLEPKDP